MLISLQTTNKVVTSIEGISIEYDVAYLNEIFKTSNEGLERYTTRRIINYLGYFVENSILLEDKWCKDQIYKNKGIVLAPLDNLFLTMFFHWTNSLISVLHNAHILCLPKVLPTLLQQTLRIRCSSC